MLGQRADAWVAEDRGALAAVLELAEQREDRRRIGLLALGGNLRKNLLNGAELLRLVVDDEVALVAELLDVLAQNADAERMEGADGGAVSRVELRTSATFWISASGISLATRSCISRAALLVKVTPRMLPGAIPRSTMCAMRKVMTRVLPVPAPARISTGPRIVSTACRCCGLSVNSNSTSRAEFNLPAK